MAFWWQNYLEPIYHNKHSISDGEQNGEIRDSWPNF